MPCYFPVRAYQAEVANSNGKRPLVFRRPAAFQGNELEVPCGRCIGCRLERSRQWALRCMHEAQMHEENAFLTLTYKPENLPKYGSLNFDDLQKFMKRLRKFLAPKQVRFFACGEYGENLTHSLNGKFGHPHFHICLFGHDFHDDKELYKVSNGVKLYTSQTLQKLWPFGFSTIGDVTFESAAYTARYVMKKQLGKGAKEIDEETGLKHYEMVIAESGEIIEIQPEGTRMSRRPGIGKTWYDKYKRDLKKDFITSRGVKMKPPKYYDSQLEIEDPVEFEKIKAKRKIDALKNQKDDYYRRLEDGHKIKQKRTKQLIRNLDYET